MDYSVILANVFQVCEGGIILLVSGALTIALHKAALYLHLKNEDALKDSLDYALTTGVHSAENWANAKAVAPSGSDKMDEAIKVSRMLLTNDTFKTFTDAQLKKLIEAALSKEGLGVGPDVTDTLAPGANVVFAPTVATATVPVIAPAPTVAPVPAAPKDINVSQAHIDAIAQAVARALTQPQH